MKKTMVYTIKGPDKIINYWKKEKVAVFWIIVSGIIYNIGMVLGPVFQGKLIDGLNQKMHLTEIISVAMMFVGAILIVQIFRYIKRFYIRRFANSTIATMRFMLYHTIVHKSEKELSRENMGILMTKAVSDVDVCVEGMRKFTTELFDTGVLLVTYTVTMLVYDVKVTVISCIFIPVAMLIAKKLKLLIYKYTIAYRDKSGKIAGITYDRVENVLVYRLYGREHANESKYFEELKDFEKKSIAANLWEDAMQPVYNVIAMIGVVSVIGMGAGKVFDGTWTIGVFTAYMTIFAATALKASKAAKLFNSVQKSQVSWKRIKPYMTAYQDYMEADSEPDNEPDSGPDRDTKSEAATETVLVIHDLRFAYDGMDENMLNGIELKSASGKLIGVTGPVACGKSTFGKIFLGEMTFAGSVKINGRDLLEYSQAEKSGLISYLGHEPNLISDTIYNNITLGDEGDISEVMRLVCFDKEIGQMENGEETLVGNGGIRLSGGQQSRIALARALYHRNRIMILDDPFSAVDKHTEEQIICNIRKYCTNSLIILISHRLHIFDQMDSVILMNRDKTYEYGTHEQLLEKSSLYRELYHLQENGGEDDENE